MTRRLMAASGLCATPTPSGTLGRIGVTGWRRLTPEEGGSKDDGEGVPIQFRTPWLQPPCIEASTLPACLVLLFPFLVADSLNFHPSGPSPCMVGILAGLFSLLHLVSVAWRAAMFSVPATAVGGAISNVSALLESTDVPTRAPHLNPVRPLLWVHVFADFTFAHVAFVLLICFLPWQASKLNLWTDNWTGLILRQKRQLTGCRFALARLLANCAPRHNLVDLLDPYYGNPLGLVSQGYDDTGVMAVSIRAGPTVRARLERHNSVNNNNGSSNNSNRSREATVVADCVRRLNKLICLIDDLAAGGFSPAYHSGDSLIDDTVKALEKDAAFMSTFADRSFPSLLKVYCVGPTLVFASGLCPPHSEGNANGGEHLVQLAYFAQLLKRIFDELRVQAKRSDDFYYVEIGLHVGPTIVGIVGQTRPKLIVVEETPRYALRLADSQQQQLQPGVVPPTVPDGSTTLYEGVSSIERTMILASTRFVSSLSKSAHLADPLPISAGRRIELADGGSGSGGIYVWPAEVCELEQFGSFARQLKICLAKGVRDHQPQHQPLRHRSSVDRHERAASHLMDTRADATFVTPSTYRRLHHRMSEQLVVSFPQKTSPLPAFHPAAVGSAGGAGDLASSVPIAPPLPPHKRNYITAGEFVLNTSSVSRKFSSPVSRPETAAQMGVLRSSSMDTPDAPPVWAEHYSSSSIKPPSDMQDTVDRGRFVTPVQIVNGYAQPHLLPPSPSPVMGFSRVHGMSAAPLRASPECTSMGQSIQQSKQLKASPYCVTSNLHDTLDSSFVRSVNPVNSKPPNVYAVPGRYNEVQDPPSQATQEDVFLEAPRSPAKDLRPESMNSEDLFLAAERACTSSVGEVTSLSSKNLSDPEDEGEQGSTGVTSASVGASVHARVSKKKVNGGGGSETSDSFHHNNPLYTDNEYESLAESHNNLLNMGNRAAGVAAVVSPGGGGCSEVPWTLPGCSADLDADMQWLRDVRMTDAPTQSEQFDPASRSVVASEVSASDGQIFPDYKRPSTPLGVLHFPTGISYDPPATFGAFLPPTHLKHSPSQPSPQQPFQSYPFAPASSTSDSKIGCLPSATFKTSASLDLMSTRVIPSVGRQSDYDGMTTDFGDDEATQNSPSRTDPSRSELDEEMTRPPSGMESSWMSEKDRSCEFSGSNIPPGQPDAVDCCGMEPCVNDQMTDSLLVETGGPIEDDLSEFSCAPSSVSKPASCCKNGECCEVRRGGRMDDRRDDHRGDYPPPSDASLPPSSAVNGDQSKRSCLPEIAPVGLPNFQCTRVDGFSNMVPLTGAYDNLPQVYRPLPNGDLFPAQPAFQPHASFSPAKGKLSGTYRSEYDNASSGRGSERRTPQRHNQPVYRLGDYSSRHRNVAMVLRQRLDAAAAQKTASPGHQYQPRNHPSTGWKLGRSTSGRSRAALSPRGVLTPFDAEIVNEARRICQRFQALGWRSVLSVDSEDQEPASYSESIAPSVGSSKPLFLLPDPQPVLCNHLPVSAAAVVSPSLRTTNDANSEAFDSDFGDHDFEANSHQQQPQAAAAVAPHNHHGSRLFIPWSLASGRSQSVDCLTSATFDVEEELLREADLEGDFLSSSDGASDAAAASSESVAAPSSAVADTSSSSSDEAEEEESKADTVPSAVIRTRQQSGRRRRCRRPHCSLLRRRAAQVRRLLPLELQPYVMPGCVSSVSPSTRHSSPPLSRKPSICLSTVVGSTAAGQRRASGLGLRLLCIRTPHRSASDPQLGLRATNFTVSLR